MLSATKTWEFILHYLDDSTLVLNHQELKERFNYIQIELRYLSYTSKVLATELSGLVQKLEILSVEIGEET